MIVEVNMDTKDLTEMNLADSKELATRGDSEAQFELGLRYYEGDGTRSGCKTHIWG
jgi:hypothetical protein